MLAPNGSSVAVSSLEASYVSKVGMNLNDAVNKVFPHANAGLAAVAAGAPAASMHDSALVTYRGLCAPRVDRAREVGQIIATELHLAVNDPYLLRSLLRSAVLKSLSIFLSRMESLIIAPASDPTILTVARTVKEAEAPPISQKFSFMILRSAWELKRGLVKACTLTGAANGAASAEQMPKFVHDTLTPWISKFDLLANRIWNPILTAIKEEVVKTIVVQGAQEANVTPPAPTPLALPTVSGVSAASSGTRSLSLSRVGVSAGHHGAPASPASGAGGYPVPGYLRDLSSLLAATGRTFAWLSVAELDHQKWKVQIGSLTIWKMLLVISSMRVEGTAGAAIRRRQSPPAGMGGGTVDGAAGASAAAPLPRRSMSAMGMGRLRPSSSGAGAALSSGKRSPSPPASHGSAGESALVRQSSKLACEVEMFESILETFVASLLPSRSSAWDGHAVDAAGDPNAAPCPRKKACPVCRGRYIPLDLDDSDDEEALPREAMQEAMTALSSFIVILRAFAVDPAPVPTMLRAIEAVDDLSLAPELCPNLIRALDTSPPLVLLQEIVSRIPRAYGFRFPHELWSTTWRDFESTMKGFHTGEEWVGEIGWELLKEAKRVHAALLREEYGDEKAVDPVGWLRLLRDAVTDLAEVDDLDGANDSGTAGLPQY